MNTKKIKAYFNSKNLTVALGYLGLYLIVAGIAWAAFTLTSGGGGGIGSNLTGLAKERSKIVELPRTEVCPINGGMFTEVERDIWEDRRPLTIIIENHVDARPLSGLSRADVVYEAIAESGVTRFLGVFHCAAAGEDFKAAVVRSARVHFIKWAAEYGNDPIFLHWGGANNFCPDCPNGVKTKGQVAPEVDAYALLDKLAWRNGQHGNDFDGGYNLGLPVVKRLPNRLSVETDAIAEHTPTVFIDEAYKEAADRGFASEDDNGLAWDEGYRSWLFKDGEPVASPDASNISFEFWQNEPDYEVEWQYDPATNSYSRFNGGSPFVDWEFDSIQIAAKNIAVQFIVEKGNIDREHHVFYQNIGEGDAIVFQNGTVIEGTWVKDDITERTIFLDEDGEEIEFVRGTTWIEGLPVGNDIVYN